MTDVDRLDIALHELLWNEEVRAVDACNCSMEILKRNEFDRYATRQHEENCMRLETVRRLVRLIHEVLDSFRFEGV